MPDVFTKKKRSEVMSRIRSRGNKETELVLAKLFRANGITGWRRHIQIRSAKRGVRKGGPRTQLKIKNVILEDSALRFPNSELRKFAVRPDFVFRRERVAVFVDGCFWHGCPKHANLPRNNRAFWRRKLAANRARDRLVTRTLRRLGWRVVRLWEHQLAKFDVSRILRGRKRTGDGVPQAR